MSQLGSGPVQRLLRKAILRDILDRCQAFRSTILVTDDLTNGADVFDPAVRHLKSNLVAEVTATRSNTGHLFRHMLAVLRMSAIANLFKSDDRRSDRTRRFGGAPATKRASSVSRRHANAPVELSLSPSARRVSLGLSAVSIRLRSIAMLARCVACAIRLWWCGEGLAGWRR